MRLQNNDDKRCGATMIESVLIFSALMMLLVGAFDLGMGVFRQYVLSEAARQGVRKAIVHGNLCPSGWNGGPWGTATYGPSAATDSDVKAQAISPFLTGLDPSLVTVKYSWPDNSNAAEKRVKVELSTTWTPILGFIFGGTTYTINASSEMQIAH
ncbi:MAG: TadE family protein [Gemmataceae bacterium]